MKKIISSLIFVLLIGAAGYLAYKQFLMTPKVFVPYESSKLQNRPANLDETNRTFIEKRMAGIQKTITEFKPETPNNDKIDYYFALSADQQLLWQGLEAKKSLESALALKYDAHIIHAYASLLYELGDSEGAMKYVDMSIDSAPDVTNFWQTKIKLAQELYKETPKELNQVYLDGIKATKEDIDLLTLYASYLTQIGQKQEAIRYWEKAIEKNPSARDVYQSEIKNLQ
jgi:tetratricopeptide (TPR) repeat protein